MSKYKEKNTKGSIKSVSRPTLNKYLFEYYVSEYKKLTKQNGRGKLKIIDIDTSADYLFLKSSQLIKLIDNYNKKLTTIQK